MIRTGVLVFILPAPNSAHRAHAGEIRVVGARAPAHFRGDEQAWYLDGIDFLMWTARYLRPLENPGEDAIDETLIGQRAPKEVVA